MSATPYICVNSEKCCSLIEKMLHLYSGPHYTTQSTGRITPNPENLKNFTVPENASFYKFLGKKVNDFKGLKTLKVSEFFILRPICTWI